MEQSKYSSMYTKTIDAMPPPLAIVPAHRHCTLNEVEYERAKALEVVRQRLVWVRDWADELINSPNHEASEAGLNYICLEVQETTTEEALMACHAKIGRAWKKVFNATKRKDEQLKAERAQAVQPEAEQPQAAQSQVPPPKNQTQKTQAQHLKGKGKKRRESPRVDILEKIEKLKARRRSTRHDGRVKAYRQKDEEVAISHPDQPAAPIVPSQATNPTLTGLFENIEERRVLVEDLLGRPEGEAASLAKSAGTIYHNTSPEGLLWKKLTRRAKAVAYFQWEKGVYGTSVMEELTEDLLSNWHRSPHLTQYMESLEVSDKEERRLRPEIISGMKAIVLENVCGTKGISAILAICQTQTTPIDFTMMEAFKTMLCRPQYSWVWVLAMSKDLWLQNCQTIFDGLQAATVQNTIPEITPIVPTSINSHAIELQDFNPYRDLGGPNHFDPLSEPESAHAYSQEVSPLDSLNHSILYPLDTKCKAENSPWTRGSSADTPLWTGDALDDFSRFGSTAPTPPEQQPSSDLSSPLADHPATNPFQDFNIKSFDGWI